MGDASVVSPDMNSAPQMPQDNLDNTMNGNEQMPDMNNSDMDNDVDMNMDMDMGNEDGGNVDHSRKEIQKNIGKACADFRNYQGQDKADLQKWVEGMLDSILDDSDAGIGEESEEPDIEEPTPQMESVVFTKKQLDKINESFNITDSEEEKKTNTLEKKKKTKNNNSPFSNPKLNK